jgi:hypothetical protein
MAEAPNPSSGYRRPPYARGHSSQATRSVLKRLATVPLLREQDKALLIEAVSALPTLPEREAAK